MEYLVQILLPATDNEGHPFPKRVLERVKGNLVDRFGGVTAFSRAPAQGIWEDSDGEENHDDVVIVEVMTPDIDAAWWSSFRRSLEKDLAQDKIVIRASSIRTL